MFVFYLWHRHLGLFLDTTQTTCCQGGAKAQFLSRPGLAGIALMVIAETKSGVGF